MSKRGARALAATSRLIRAHDGLPIALLLRDENNVCLLVPGGVLKLEYYKYKLGATDFKTSHTPASTTEVYATLINEAVNFGSAIPFVLLVQRMIR